MTETQQQPSPLCACATHCAARRLDPSSSQHAAYVDAAGVLHYQHIDTSTCSTTQLLRFQLQYSAGEGLPFEPISKPWRFEFVPGMPGDVLLVQEGSCRILYASFPRQGSASSDVFLFGSHTGACLCFCVLAFACRAVKQQSTQQRSLSPPPHMTHMHR